jgi:hypothetical protein
VLKLALALQEQHRLKVFKNRVNRVNRVLRKAFGYKKEELEGTGGYCGIYNLMIRQIRIVWVHSVVY